MVAIFILDWINICVSVSIKKGNYMLVSFNAYKPNMNFKVGLKNNANPQSFTSLKDGRIVAEEVAKNSSVAEICRKCIYLGAYKPTLENLQALLKAKEIAAKSPYEKISLPMALDEAIDMLKIKAKEVGINLSL